MAGYKTFEVFLLNVKSYKDTRDNNTTVQYQ